MEDFVSFDLAKKLKDKGFDIPCIYAYCEQGGWNMYTQKHEPITHKLRTDGNPFGSFYVGKNWNIEYERNKNKIRCSAPTISQVLKWLRNEKEYHIEFVGNACGYLFIVSDIPSKGGTDRYCSNYDGSNDGGTWDSYEEAAIAGIEYTLDKLI